MAWNNVEIVHTVPASHLAPLSVHEVVYSGELTQGPRFDGHVLANGDEVLSSRVAAQSADEPCVCSSSARALESREVPHFDHAIASTGQHCPQARWVFAETVDAICVSGQGTKERFGEDSLQFSGVKRPHILPGCLHRVECGVQVPWQSVDVASSFADIVAGVSAQYFDLHDCVIANTWGRGIEHAWYLILFDPILQYIGKWVSGRIRPI